MDQAVSQEDTPPVIGDEQNLSRAIELLSQHNFVRSLISSAKAAGYEFQIDLALQVNAVHRSASKKNLTPQIRFASGRTCEVYADSLCHELIHFAIKRAGRIYGVRMTPIADMEMRQCEEAAVYAITSDLMYQAAHGINMEGNKTRPELWATDLKAYGYTAGAYEAHKGDHNVAVQEAFKRFYTMPDEEFRASYQAFSVNAILGETPETLLNPGNFTEDFDPVAFARFLPAPYDQILMPCLSAMKPDDAEYLLVGLPLAKKIEAGFVKPRRAAHSFETDWRITVSDQDNRHFLWSPSAGSLAQQRRKGSDTLAHAA